MAYCSGRRYLMTVLFLCVISGLTEGSWFIPFSFAGTLLPQGSEAGAPIGRLIVPGAKMAGQCLTMVSPNYPPTVGQKQKSETVILKVVVSKSGTVAPMHMISGPNALENEAMNTVRHWVYKPYTQDGDPIDVTTEVAVDFVPGRRGGLVTHPNH